MAGPQPCPDCPECGHPPMISLAEQSFCGNDGCRLVMWNPTLPPAELRRQIAEAAPENLLNLPFLPPDQA